MSWSLQWHEYVGLLGDAVVLAAYYGLQSGRMRGDGLAFQWANIVGCVLITVSLMYDFNLAAMVIELAWIAISVYGLMRGIRMRRLTRESSPGA